MITFFGTLGGILLVLVALVVFVGQKGCETQEIPKATSEQKQQAPFEEGVQIIVYQQGKKTELDSSSPDFKKLQKICEEMVTSARLAPTPASPPLEQIVEDLKNNSEVIEINYLQSKTFSIASREIEAAQLVMPLHTYITSDPDIKEWAEFFILNTETSDYLLIRLSANKAKKDLSIIKELLLQKFNIFIL